MNHVRISLPRVRNRGARHCALDFSFLLRVEPLRRITQIRYRQIVLSVDRKVRSLQKVHSRIDFHRDTRSSAACTFPNWLHESWFAGDRATEILGLLVADIFVAIAGPIGIEGESGEVKRDLRTPDRTELAARVSRSAGPV